MLSSTGRSARAGRGRRPRSSATAKMRDHADGGAERHRPHRRQRFEQDLVDGPGEAPADHGGDQQEEAGTVSGHRGGRIIHDTCVAAAGLGIIRSELRGALRREPIPPGSERLGLTGPAVGATALANSIPQRRARDERQSEFRSRRPRRCRPHPRRLGPQGDADRRDRDARSHGHPRGVRGHPAPARRPHHGLAAHDHPDRGPHRDAPGARCGGALGILQYLQHPGPCRRRHRRLRASRYSR